MSTVAAPPSGKKREKARRVFGDAVVDDHDTSLAYSPCSSSKVSGLSWNDTLSLANAQSNSTAVHLFTEESFQTSDASTAGYSSGSKSHIGPFDRIIATSATPGKENSSGIPAHVVSGPVLQHSSPPKSTNHHLQEELKRMRTENRSPLRRDLVRKTQDAINKAAVSVNQSINAARLAKQENLRQKFQQTTQVRQEWEQDRAEAASFYQQSEHQRRQILSLERQLSSKNSQEKAQREMLLRQSALEQTDQQVEFNSSVYRDHQRALRDEQERRRRQSLAARARLRANNHQGTKQLHLQRIEEEQIVFEERHQASIAQREFNRNNAEQRRKSFQFRSGDARRIRAVHARLQSDEAAQHHASYELKWQAEKDVEAYQREMAQQRRTSLAGRNATAKQIRALISDQKADEAAKAHESFELNQAANRDADAYQRQLSEERRNSYAFRVKEGTRQRQESAEAAAKTQQDEHESYELKWAGEDDATAYQRRLQQARRESLAQRNRTAWNIAQQEEQVHSEQLAAAHASYELKWAGEKDALAYQRQLEEERRNSLAGRNKYGKVQRDLVEQQRNDELASTHKSYELKWAGEKDAEEYQRRLEAERRESLQKRGRATVDQRAVLSDIASEAMRKEHASYELKWEGEKDAEAYRLELNAEQRESTKRRNAERVQHAQVMEELRTIAREKETESLVLKWAAEEDAKVYLKRLEEERRQSLRLRGQEVVHSRQVDDDQKSERIQKAHEDELLRAADQTDVENYRKQCAERDRASFEYRRKESRKQRLEEQERTVRQQLVEASNFELETEARSDVEGYLLDCKQRRRLSLAFRAREKRHHARVRQERAQEERDARSRDVRDRLRDQRYVALAQQEERAKIAMDAIQHSNCSFNPFNCILK